MGRKGTNSKGKLPRSGGMGLDVFCRPPGPPKDIVGGARSGSGHDWGLGKKRQKSQEDDIYLCRGPI